jgi:hypothetical protein
MSRKTTVIIYWVCTILFAGLMTFSSVGGLEPNQQTIQLMHDYLGYPIYFIQLISYAKLVGLAVIIIPGVPKWMKEWAYAGLFIDLFTAIYSGIAVGGFDQMMLTMLIWIAPGVVSYILWKKLWGHVIHPTPHK